MKRSQSGWELFATAGLIAMMAMPVAAWAGTADYFR